MAESWTAALERFRAFGSQPDVERYLDLFDPEGTVVHPGMAAPVRGAGIREFIEGALRQVPDFRLEPMRWCGHGDLVFVEARNTGTVGGHKVAYPSVYRLVTRSGRVLSGQAFYDRAAVLSHLEPALASRRGEPHTQVLDTGGAVPLRSGGAHAADAAIYTRFLQPYVQNWQAPRPEKFPEFYCRAGAMVMPGIPGRLGRDEIAGHYRSLMSEIADLRLSLERWAYHSSVLFAEWRLTGSAAGRRCEMGLVDRFLLSGACISESVTYFDSFSMPTQASSQTPPGTIFTTR